MALPKGGLYSLVFISLLNPSPDGIGDFKHEACAERSRSIQSLTRITSGKHKAVN